MKHKDVALILQLIDEKIDNIREENIKMVESFNKAIEEQMGGIIGVSSEIDEYETDEILKLKILKLNLLELWFKNNE